MGRVGNGKGGVGLGWVGCVWVGHLLSNYECFPISGCKDIDFKKTPTQKYCFLKMI